MPKNGLIETLRVPAKKGSKYEEIRRRDEKKREEVESTIYIRTLSDVPLRIFLLFALVTVLYLAFSSITFWTWVLNHLGFIAEKNNIHEEEL